MFAQINSLVNPLLYCYRDQRFKNAIRELLGLTKPQAIQSAVGATQFSRRKYSVRSLELPKLEKRMERFKISASCSPTDALYSIHGTPSVVMSKKSLSAPTLNTSSSCLDADLNLQRPLSPVETSATIHVEGSV